MFLGGFTVRGRAMSSEVEAEVKAMGAVAGALQGLTPEAVRRVLNWASQAFLGKSLPVGVGALVTQSGSTPQSASDAIPSEPLFREFHDLFDAANPTTGVDKVLVAGYWFQVVEKSEDLDGMELNRALKNLGHPSSNITRDLDALIRRSPRMVMQVSKGPAGRKRYKLTREGERAVSRMILAAQGNREASLTEMPD
jgi:hypothetical protein